ncbi:serine/arginine-rich splicing factor RS31-like isoform X1 [Arachis stenosperma]|uniref:serine/arginine-rich splicing factor RS31-like isoform X1 n=1 Tax=Arachis stenosperma TaxID=217475 RepID=UPI0025ABD2FD|nr:serine/arginine-rich splicing factor RS31-like isoform X1 [Arachis stenosperma]XP_057743323.1 serine/arginine-rich splicing factor RS31-like isoform X1 [Arachis stenosperma]XP_057743324.1 serine/arginine-rich splicing factor RS31-like isoform X1 [Arachis stenosperma]
MPSFNAYRGSMYYFRIHLCCLNGEACLAVTISDLNFGFKSYNCNHDFVHHSTPLYSFLSIRAPLIFSGFAFVYYEDERDAEEAIRALDNFPFGYEKRRLSVEWARGERGRHRDGSRANQKPTKTLFVINFDPIRTRVRDIEKHFEPYGKVLHVRIRRNFAFVQFETQEDATKALECTNMSKILDRVVSVEYALRDDGDRGDKYDSPRRGGYDRSPSPAYRRRPSPDYGHPHSPVYDRYNGPDRRRSPDYGRQRSPDYGRHRSPDYGRYRSRSPARRSRT